MSYDLKAAFRSWERERVAASAAHQQSLEDIDKQSVQSKFMINLGTNPFMDPIDSPSRKSLYDFSISLKSRVDTSNTAPALDDSRLPREIIPDTKTPPLTPFLKKNLKAFLKRNISDCSAAPAAADSTDLDDDDQIQDENPDIDNKLNHTATIFEGFKNKSTKSIYQDYNKPLTNSSVQTPLKSHSQYAAAQTPHSLNISPIQPCYAMTPVQLMNDSHSSSKLSKFPLKYMQTNTIPNSSLCSTTNNNNSNIHQTDPISRSSFQFSQPPSSSLFRNKSSLRSFSHMRDQQLQPSPIKSIHQSHLLTSSNACLNQSAINNSCNITNLQYSAQPYQSQPSIEPNLPLIASSTPLALHPQQPYQPQQQQQSVPFISIPMIISIGTTEETTGCTQSTHSRAPNSIEDDQNLWLQHQQHPQKQETQNLPQHTSLPQQQLLPLHQLVESKITQSKDNCNSQQQQQISRDGFEITPPNGIINNPIDFRMPIIKQKCNYPLSNNPLKHQQDQLQLSSRHQFKDYFLKINQQQQLKSPTQQYNTALVCSPNPKNLNQPQIVRQRDQNQQPLAFSVTPLQVSTNSNHIPASIQFEEEKQFQTPASPLKHKAANPLQFQSSNQNSMRTSFIVPQQQQPQISLAPKFVLQPAAFVASKCLSLSQKHTRSSSRNENSDDQNNQMYSSKIETFKPIQQVFTHRKTQSSSDAAKILYLK